MAEKQSFGEWALSNDDSKVRPCVWCGRRTTHTRPLPMFVPMVILVIATGGLGLIPVLLYGLYWAWKNPWKCSECGNGFERSL